MKYSLTTPCDQCPFLIGSGFTYARLREFASGEFPCHKTCKTEEREDEGTVYVARSDKTPHCAGALIFNEKRNTTTQMMRICERLGVYDHTKLDMDANVGDGPRDYRVSARGEKP